MLLGDVGDGGGNIRRFYVIMCTVLVASWIWDLVINFI